MPALSFEGKMHACLAYAYGRRAKAGNQLNPNATFTLTTLTSPWLMGECYLALERKPAMHHAIQDYFNQYAKLPHVNIDTMKGLWDELLLLKHNRDLVIPWKG